MSTTIAAAAPTEARDRRDMQAEATCDMRTLLSRAATEAARGDVSAAMDAVASALAAAKKPRQRVEAMLWQARGEAEWLGQLETALETYWQARRSAHRNRDARLVALADYGIGTTYLDLGRTNEGLEAVQRAVRSSQRTGNLTVRGCGELILAEHYLREGKLALACRGLDVASDLLRASGATAILARADVLREEAERLSTAAAVATAAPAPRVTVTRMAPTVKAQALVTATRPRPRMQNVLEAAVG